MKNNEEGVVRRLSRIEAYLVENRFRVESFLDRNGYTVREIRAIARHAVALWETQAAV